VLVGISLALHISIYMHDQFAKKNLYTCMMARVLIQRGMRRAFAQR
jgi:hypothetical protein